MNASRAPRVALGLWALIYATSVAVASARPEPRAWGLHLPGFLPPPLHAILVLVLFIGAGLLLLDATGSGGPSRRAPTRPGGAARSRGSAGPPQLPRSRPRAWLPATLALSAAALFWVLRARTHFLGDGIVWLAGLRSGELKPYSEPLAAAIWSGFAGTLRLAGLAVDEPTVAMLSVACGAIAVAVLWGIAGEVATPGRRKLALGLLATLGSMQLYFGYIESYPPTSVALLTYLWLGLRRARGAADPWWWLPLSLAIAVTCHLATAYLLPSYAILVARGRGSPARRVALAALPVALAAAILTLLGSRPEQWLGSLRIAAAAVRAGHDVASLSRPYAILSLGHAIDLVNAIVLVLPVPALLLLSRAAAGDATASRMRGDALFLLAAAIPGVLLAAALMLPVPPAQDWDLTALFLLPLAVLGVRSGAGPSGAVATRRREWGLLTLGLGALASFVLVNTDRSAGIRRFETLVGPGAKITAYGRAYGNELLSDYYEDRRDHDAVLRHASRARGAEPTNPRYWVKTGYALYELGRYDEAIATLEEAIRRGPNREDAHYNLGLCYVHVGRLEEAVSEFGIAAASDEARPEYKHNLGVALFRAGAVDSARAVWEDVLHRWPGYALTQRSLMRHFGGAGADSGIASPGLRSGPP